MPLTDTPRHAPLYDSCQRALLRHCHYYADKLRFADMSPLLRFSHTLRQASPSLMPLTMAGHYAFLSSPFSQHALYAEIPLRHI